MCRDIATPSGGSFEALIISSVLNIPDLLILTRHGGSGPRTRRSLSVCMWTLGHLIHHTVRSVQYPLALAFGFTWLGNGSRMLFGALFQITSARFDIRLTICAATPPAAPNNPHHPNVTKPQCNGAENNSSTNQNAWPHSFKPTFGRMNIG